MLSINTKIDDFELVYVRIFWEFRMISMIWEPTTAKWMKIDSYCQNCSLLNVLFSGVSRWLWYRRASCDFTPPRGVKQECLQMKSIQMLSMFLCYVSVFRKRYEIHPKLLLTTNRKMHMLSIDTKIADLGWPWTAVSWNFGRISQIL